MFGIDYHKFSQSIIKERKNTFDRSMTNLYCEIKSMDVTATFFASTHYRALCDNDYKLLHDAEL